MQGVPRFIALSNVIITLFSNHSAVERKQIIFTLKIMIPDKNQGKASRLLIATQAKYRNTRFTNQRKQQTYLQGLKHLQ